nr:zinc transporter ZIP11-like isoform X2 [Penaeus vannamei]
MLEGASPVTQALLGTLLTWGLTAAGSAVVFLLAGTKRKVLDSSLGFAAGVMTAASFWSLLAPAIELAESSGSYGSEGEWAFVPVAVGFVLGAAFVYAADVFMSSTGSHSPNFALAMQSSAKKTDGDDARIPYVSANNFSNANDVKQRRGDPGEKATQSYEESSVDQERYDKHLQWRRILLLIIAITVHNIPEGLAVGVGFGAIGKTPLATFNKAK